MCEGEKKGEKSISQSELWLFLELQLDLCFWFSTLSSLSLTHFPPNHPSFPSLTNNSPHTPHEHARNAVNDNTLALFIFTTPSFHTPPPFHHTNHATRPHRSLTVSNHCLWCHQRCHANTSCFATHTPLLLNHSMVLNEQHRL